MTARDATTAPRVLTVEHEDGTGPGYLGDRIVAGGVRLELVRPYLGELLPATLSGYQGLVVLGGSLGPFDDERATWLPAVRRLMAEALADAVPLLGVCLGGELLADVAGGRVGRAPAGPELGIQTVRLTPDGRSDALFGDLPELAPAVEWHWEEIVELPPGSTLLCGTDRFPHQAFRVGESAWGTQFHPEVLLASASEWARHGADDLRRAGVDPERVIADVAEAEPRLRSVWGGLADRWTRYVIAQAGRPGEAPTRSSR